MNEKILAGRYVLVEQIGVGGMAIVYRAIDRNTGHSVAVKVLKPEFNRDAEFVSRFQREAEAASKMTHHNIVNLLDVGMDGENRYLIMEYVKGKTLKEVIQEKGRLSAPVAVQITIRILSALQHAHQNGIIHRDIKPQNILVHADGHIKVADFGIARMANSSTLTRGDSVMGSVHYFSPEQAQGKGTDVTSDLYSVGVTLYEMLTGRVPFDGDSPVAIAMQHLHAAPEPIQRFAPDVPDAICHVCMKAMEKDPQYRYRSAREMASELRMALEGRVSDMQPRLVENLTAAAPSSSSASRPMPVRQTTARSRTRHSALRWWVVTGMVTLVVLYGLYLGTMAIYEKVVNSATVEAYVGRDAEDAKRAISRAGLVAEVVEINHPTVTAGTVVMQAPQEDTTLRKGDKVVLTISKGPASLSVPSVVGKTRQDAQTILKSSGLIMTVVEYVVSTTLEAGKIVDQYPLAGSLCESGDIIQVTISGGVAYVPRVTGKQLDEAKELIAAAGMGTDPLITYVETDETSLHGRVSQQSIAAEKQVIQGTNISLTVYRVPALMCKANIILDLPAADGLTSVRVTLQDESSESPVYTSEFPANASRHPEVTLQTDYPGVYTYRVYINNEFKYSGTVTFE